MDIEQPRALIGKTTDDSLQSGIVYGFAGQVDGICRRLRAELGEGITTIATGGLARVIVGFTETIDRSMICSPSRACGSYTSEIADARPA